MLGAINSKVFDVSPTQTTQTAEISVAYHRRALQYMQNGWRRPFVMLARSLSQLAKWHEIPILAEMCFFFFLLHKQNTEKQQQQQDEHCNKYKNRQNPSSNATATQPHTKPKATSPRHVPIYELLFQGNSRHGSPSPACVSIRVARVNYYFSLLRKASARGVIKKR